MLSVVSMLFVREEVEEKETNRVDVVQSVRAIIGYLRTDGRLRRLVAAQFALGVAGAAFPFFVVRARELIPSGDEMIGAFLVLQNLGGVAAAITCGYLMDRLGSWVSIRTGAALQTTALLAVIVAGLVDAPHLLYLPAFFMLGFVGGSSWWSFTSYLLDIATDEQRPTYLAASGILTSPTFVGSILVGGLFEVALPEAVFAAAMVVSAAGLLLAWALPKIRAGASAAPESRPSVAPAREHGR
jgi:MFS family permease